jgi:SET domain-containing protein
MNNQTTELSFVLKVSTIPDAGIGVFALHDIASGVWLEVIPREYKARRFKGHELPDELRAYCIAKGNNVYTCPQQFNRMDIGWYMNHSATPNADWDDDLDGYVSSKPIAAGEEILINYNLFEEPAQKKQEYYEE